MYLELSKNIDAPLMSKSIHRCCCLRVKVHLCQRRQHQGGSSFLCRPTPPSRPGVLPGPPRARCLPSPDYRRGEVSAEEEKISAWRGLRTMEERDSWGGSRGYSGGGQFFPKENHCKLLFVPNFTFTFISESEIRPCTFCLCTVCNSM